MADNNLSRIRLDRVSQSATVRCERVSMRTTRPQVNDNLFDGSQRRVSQPSGSASRSHLSLPSTSRGHESLDDAAEPKVPEAQ